MTDTPPGATREFLDDLRTRITTRMEELQPLVDEYQSLLEMDEQINPPQKRKRRQRRKDSIEQPPEGSTGQSHTDEPEQEEGVAAPTEL